MITKQQAAEAFNRFLEAGDFDDAYIVADYLTSNEKTNL